MICLPDAPQEAPAGLHRAARERECFLMARIDHRAHVKTMDRLVVGMVLEGRLGVADQRVGGDAQNHRAFGVTGRRKRPCAARTRLIGLLRALDRPDRAPSAVPVACAVRVQFGPRLRGELKQATFLPLVQDRDVEAGHLAHRLSLLERDDEPVFGCATPGAIAALPLQAHRKALGPLSDGDGHLDRVGLHLQLGCHGRDKSEESAENEARDQ